MRLAPGTRLDGYEILGPIGSGGMGEVYRARDPMLKREVAIKVLPAFVSQDSDRLRRFEQEAQAAAALNHPNILAVYQFGTFQGAPYLVSELLEGDTLRQVQSRGPIPVRKAIDYGVQIAHGLAAAHEKGIVHRDLKPENLFVTKDGRVKILDFGLAKLTQRQPDADGVGPTISEGTDPGVVMGTVGYMSPEQVRGKAVDHHADIFAFGAILYEMLTGNRAFHRSTSAETMTAILNDEPPGISQVVQSTPPGLQRVVHRCLEKNPEQRFQSASDLAFALEAVSESGSAPAVALEKGKRSRWLWAAAGIKRRKSPLRLAAFCAAILLVVIGAGLLIQRAVKRTRALGQSAHTAAASSRMRIIPVTTFPGTASDLALSPDGEKIAFIWNGENPVMGDLYVQLVGGERPLRLTHTNSGFICCADWSPDGREIAFGRCNDNGGAVYIVPALGGPERKLTDVVCPFGAAGFPKWIDGKSMLLADRCVPDGPGGIVVFSLETGEKRCLTSPPLHSELGDFFPFLSPVGTTVAFLRSTTINVAEIYTVALSGGNPKQLTHEGGGVGNPMWSADGKHIIFRTSQYGLMRVSALGGAVERETVYPASGTLSHDGRRLAYIEDLGSSLELRRITLAGAGGKVVSQDRIVAPDGGILAPQPSPNGREIVFNSCRSAVCEIWKSDADGGNPLQLTFFESGSSGTPRWSPDGKWIAFDYSGDRHAQIYMVDSDGRNLHPVTSGDHENVVPSWSSDGTAVYFASNRKGSMQVWRRELANGREEQLTRHGGFAAFESNDAKTLYYSKFEGGGIWSIPVGGGEEKQVTEALHRAYWGHFAVTEAGIYLLNSEETPRPTIMFYNFQTRRLSPVLQLEQHPVPWTANLTASRDGKTLWFVQGGWHTSIRMAENFQ